MRKPVDESEAAISRPASPLRSLWPLTVHGVTVTDRGRMLLDGISLALDKGPRTVIMGPNGAGKSLLLRVLHGLVPAQSGTVSWGGEPPSPGVLERQAMVFQKPMLLRRSVRANIAFVLRHLDAAAAAARTDGILDGARLGHLADSPARLLSGGEQQRLAIARALALEPEVLLLDEPCANLDPASTLAVEEMIARAHGLGTRIVLVTHDIGQARRIADDVVFMADGRVTEHTPAAQFFTAPASREARAYLEGRILVPRPAAAERSSATATVMRNAEDRA